MGYLGRPQWGPQEGRIRYSLLLGLGVGETSFLKTRQFEARNGQEMGNKTEFETRNGRKWEMSQTRYIIFQQQNRKTGKNRKNRGKNTKKNRKKTEEKEIYKKYRNNILTRFWEMLKRKTSFRRNFGKC